MIDSLASSASTVARIGLEEVPEGCLGVVVVVIVRHVDQVLVAWNGEWDWCKNRYVCELL